MGCGPRVNKEDVVNWVKAFIILFSLQTETLWPAERNKPPSLSLCSLSLLKQLKKCIQLVKPMNDKRKRKENEKQILTAFQHVVGLVVLGYMQSVWASPERKFLMSTEEIPPINKLESGDILRCQQLSVLSFQSPHEDMKQWAYWSAASWKWVHLSICLCVSSFNNPSLFKGGSDNIISKSFKILI